MGLEDYGEFSFVEVVVRFFEPGNKECKDLFDELELFDLNLDEYGEDIQEVVEAKAQTRKNREEAEKSGKGWWDVLSGGHDWEEDFLVSKPFCGFEFRCFSQNFDPYYSSGLASEIESVGTDWVFKGWKDELEKMAHGLVEDSKMKFDLIPSLNGRTVRFITLWKYMAWQDSYNKEWDSEYELLGLVTPSKRLLGD